MLFTGGISINRRRFLRQTGMTAVGCSLLLGPLLSAQTPATLFTSIYADSRRTLEPLDRNLFGSFLEHLGRAIYGGIYDPDAKLSDANGFRKDVLDEVKHLGVPIIRYPGGNFVSGYHWLDGVGPKKDRPRVLEKAWDSIETNQFGTNEFILWCRSVRATPLMGLNLGTGTPEQAAALVEYCNVESGTKWSDLRRSHGIAKPLMCGIGALAMRWMALGRSATCPPGNTVGRPLMLLARCATSISP